MLSLYNKKYKAEKHGACILGHNFKSPEILIGIIMGSLNLGCPNCLFPKSMPMSHTLIQFNIKSHARKLEHAEQ